MTRKSQQRWTPTPEQLAAYADGELSEAERKKIAEGLANHPDAAAEVEVHRRLQQLLRAAGPSEPSEAKWKQVQAHLQSTLTNPDHPSTLSVNRACVTGYRPRVLFGIATGLTFGVAAILFLTFTLNQDSREPFPVAASNDVQIISVDTPDVGTLVVGEPPLRGSLQPASSGDVVLQKVEPDDRGLVPELRVSSKDPDAPLVVVPRDAGLAK